MLTFELTVGVKKGVKNTVLIQHLMKQSCRDPYNLRKISVSQAGYAEFKPQSDEANQSINLCHFHSVFKYVCVGLGDAFFL